MSKKIFTEKEIKLLLDNPNVRSVSPKGITYTEGFKRTFIAENEKGKSPRQIFKKNGFKIEIIGMIRIESSGKRWRAAYRDNGVVGLRDTRKGNSGRPGDKELSTSYSYKNTSFFILEISCLYYSLLVCFADILVNFANKFLYG